MNDTPQPTAPAARQTDDGSDTVSRAVEGTGNQPAPTPAGASGTGVLPHIGEYVVIRKLGEGGMGAVYLAEDTRLGRKAAVKTMRPELAADAASRERFEREARAAAAVEHDNIVPIWRVGEAADRTPFIAMPFLQGETLDARLKRDPVANLGLILKVAREVADGLAAAHAKGLIHRDIKPGNVWLEGDLSSKLLAEQIRRCKVLDFGLARSVDKDDAQITASGAILGTPAYMAPEQARGEKVDHRADLFSLGVMLYRMATGKAPFKGPNAMAVLIALATETPAPVRELAPNLPPALAELIERLMSKDPAGRPQSAAEVSLAVREIIKEWLAKKAASSAPASGSPAPASGSQPVPVYVLPAPAPNPWEDVTEAEANEPIAHVPETKPRSRTVWYIASGVLGLLLLGAVLAVVIIRVETAEGTLVVEINDPDVEARVKNGKLVLVDKDGKERYRLSPAEERNKKIDAGSYVIHVEDADGLALDTREFTLKKNGHVTVRVTLDPKLARKADPKKDDPDRKAAEYVLSVGGTVQVNGEERVIKDAKELPKERFALTVADLHWLPGVTDAGLAVFKGCKALTVLNLDGRGDTAITDAGLANFAECKDLIHLRLGLPKVTGTGLVHFKDCKKLTTLNLGGTATDDAALAHLRGFAVLTGLDLGQTKVTSTGVTDLAKALPQCRIVSPGGTIEPTVILDPDLKAAQWALSVGGKVNINGRDITAPAELPTGPFRLIGVDLWARKAVTDADLAIFKGCKYLTLFGAPDTGIGDAGLAHLAACPSLTEVYLRGTRVTDAGLMHFKDQKNLTVLDLNGTGVTDAGIAHLKGCKNLRNLSLHLTAATDASADVFAQLPNLDALGLAYTPVTDATLARFKDRKCPPLLYLEGNKGVTDAGLVHLKDQKCLMSLDLSGTSVTDAGVVHLKDCKNLRILGLNRTKVTDASFQTVGGFPLLETLDLRAAKVPEASVKKLAATIPQCRILWGDGEIKPTAPLDPDRRAALYTLAMGGSVRVSGTEKEIKAVADLPKGRFTLTGVNLFLNADVTDAGLAPFKDCEGVTYLHLGNTKVTDAGLGHFKGCKGLTHLYLHFAPVTDAGLAHLKGCKGLTYVDLTGTAVTDAGLAVLAGCPGLTYLRMGSTAVSNAGLATLKDCLKLSELALPDTKVGDAGLAPLKNCTGLRIVSLAKTGVTDEGLAHLKGRNLAILDLDDTVTTDAGLALFRDCKELTEIRLRKTKVTEKGVTEFAKALPGCRILWDSGVIEPKK